jgi:acyl dehydratase
MGGLKLPATARAAQAPAKAPAAAGEYWDDWEYYYPGKYDSADAKVLKEFQVELAEANNKETIKAKDVIAGKYDGKSWMGRTTTVTYDSMMQTANIYVPTNPLFTDRAYGTKSPYGQMIAYPLISSLEIMPAMPKSKGIGDYMVVSAHNDTNSYYAPFCEGDTLYTVIEEQHCSDATPSQGSYYRTFVMSGWARVYNQRGELVSEAANVLKESFRRHKDPSKRNASGAHAWESPDWWSRAPHQYTDRDWDEIVAMWKKETVRGEEPLYWDEVNVGDEPTPTAVFFVMDSQADIAMSVPQFSVDIKKNVLDKDVFSKMVKNAQGIYVLPEYKEKKASSGGPMGGAMPEGMGEGGGEREGGPPEGSGMPEGGGMAEQPAELANRDGRALVQNSLAAKFAAGMICNWMGDHGWLQRVHWDIMELPPGSLDFINFQADPTRIPEIPMALRPALFDKYPYLEKVPRMRGCRAAWHCMEGDLIISRAYVTKKYQVKDEYFVDLSWWCVTLDNYLIEEGSATVTLPKKA